MKREKVTLKYYLKERKKERGKENYMEKKVIWKLEES